MIPMSNSGQLASNKQYLEHANKLRERKPVQAIAYCLIIAFKFNYIFLSRQLFSTKQDDPHTYDK